MAAITGIAEIVEPHAEDVVASAPGARWTVEEHTWAELVPALAADVALLVAPPVTVCVLPAR